MFYVVDPGQYRYYYYNEVERPAAQKAQAKATKMKPTIAPATILAATAGATERCDVWEGLLALPPPV